MSQNGRSRNDGEKLYLSKANWYSLRYPDSWVAEEGEDCTTFSNPESGVGALQVSAYETPTAQDPQDLLLEYLSDHHVSFDQAELIPQRNNGRSTAGYSYTEGAWFRRVWFVSQANHLLMITHNCKVEDRGKEDREVEQIVNSVTIDS